LNRESPFFMRIVIIGDDQNATEAREKFGPSPEYVHYPSRKHLSDAVNADVIFDFLTWRSDDSDIYQPISSPVFFNTAFASLQSILGGKDHHAARFGFCGLPTLFNRSVLEVVLQRKEDEVVVRDLCRKLDTEFLIVKDQAGLVSARVIGMIINEAYYTAEEGTASREDIDIAMKLGTNYPHGPFEWAKRIGLRNICDLLDAAYRETGDSRYAVCSLLRGEANLV
jgi:3-hydroxybutyryl-CoA dehydrogenase